MANINIVSIIVSKFYHKKKLFLIILLKIDKDLEVSFYCIILPLNLTIYLWIKGNKKFLFDT